MCIKMYAHRIRIRIQTRIRIKKTFVDPNTNKNKNYSSTAFEFILPTFFSLTTNELGCQFYEIFYYFQDSLFLRTIFSLTTKESGILRNFPCLLKQCIFILRTFFSLTTKESGCQKFSTLWRVNFLGTFSLLSVQKCLKKCKNYEIQYIHLRTLSAHH
jgi:hypothetical protein